MRLHPRIRHKITCTRTHAQAVQVMCATAWSYLSAVVTLDAPSISVRPSARVEKKRKKKEEELKYFSGKKKKSLVCLWFCNDGEFVLMTWGPSAGINVLLDICAISGNCQSCQSYGFDTAVLVICGK